MTDPDRNAPNAARTDRATAGDSALTSMTAGCVATDVRTTNYQEPQVVEAPGATVTVSPPDAVVATWLVKLSMGVSLLDGGETALTCVDGEREISRARAPNKDRAASSSATCTAWPSGVHRPVWITGQT
ncbi:hypothetical protein [Asanoa iriomotensis]|uniref:Uncharacterized protein n=1 Tax=Asanoa iriomotensis TaxID=234613 RepID=A0ABQ4BYT7_9ACTN|nr:hypothetical protein [Asanoa iriomotensis]GIF55672.1 hypothetical protein Air01nite_17670 [Asanoa iriomotensis]